MTYEFESAPPTPLTAEEQRANLQTYSVLTPILAGQNLMPLCPILKTQ